MMLLDISPQQQNSQISLFCLCVIVITMLFFHTEIEFDN